MVLQMEAAECGAAALGIILEYHGRYVPLDVLRDDCGVSRDGSNAFYIKEAAKQYGLEIKAFRKPAEGLVTRQPPFIVFWQWNHFLVVEGFGRGNVLSQRSRSGRRTVSLDEFARFYSGIAFTFTPGPQFVKARTTAQCRDRPGPPAVHSKTALAFVILAGLALVIPTLVAAAFQRLFIDEIWSRAIMPGSSRCSSPWASTALVRLAAVGLQQVYLTRLEIRLTLAESVSFLRHVLRLPVAFFQHRFTGDIVGRAVSTARVARLISGELATTAVSLLTLVFYVAVMLPYDPLLTVVGRRHQQFEPGGPPVARPAGGSTRTGRSSRSAAGCWRGVMWAIQIIESIKATGSESRLAGPLDRRPGADDQRASNTLGVYDAPSCSCSRRCWRA